MYSTTYKLLTNNEKTEAYLWLFILSYLYLIYYGNYLNTSINTISNYNNNKTIPSMLVVTC